MWRGLLVVVVVLLFSPACAKTSGNSSTNQTADDCNDLIDALTDASIRCGHDPSTARQEQLDTVVNGDCARVSSIRDHGSLQAACVPSLSTIACNAFEAHEIDPSCQLQLVRSTAAQ